MSESRKYQIFVSSTYEDLKEHRKILIDRIIELGHIPSGMEMFSAGDTNEFKVIKKAIDQSDIYVAMIGGFYGSTKKIRGKTKSYTQLEYEYARKEAKKPCIVFVLKEGEFTKIRAKVSKTNHKDKVHERKLRAFREKAMTGRIVAFFSGRRRIRSLTDKFDAAFFSLVEERKEEISGYVRGSSYDRISQQVRLFGMVGDTKIMRDIVNEFNQYDTLAKRMKENTDLKQGLASFFWRKLGGSVFQSGFTDIFFESGSTIAHLSTEMLMEFKGRSYNLNIERRERDKRFRIRTNNILTYLQCVLFSSIRMSLVPYGPPEKKYGATYGDLALNFGDPVAPAPPPAGPSEILPVANRLLKKIMKDTLLDGDKGRKIFFSAASGVQLKKGSSYPGTHVGSYPNMLLKRAIYETGCPVIIFIDETKIDNFKDNECYPVCGSGLSWRRFCSKYPIAICLSTRTRKNFKRLKKAAASHGLKSTLGAVPEPVGSSRHEVYCSLFGSDEFYERVSLLGGGR